MTDTDSELMRRQQDKDTLQAIEPDETRLLRGIGDSDPASAADRRAAKDGKAPAGKNGQDEVFGENRRSDRSAEAEVLETGRPRGAAPLGGKDRFTPGR